MNAMHSPHETAREPSAALLLLLAVGAGLAVATLYYNQPMLGVIGQDLRADAGRLGLIPTLTQIGYALGILFLAPLGDRHDRRHVILTKGAALFVALLVAALSPSVNALCVASLAVGITATLAQDIVPAAATLAPDAIRGRVVGTVMTGLLLGILLSRVVSGFVAAQFGWQAMFFAAAASIAALWVVVWRALPRIAPSTQLPYAALLKSMAALWRTHASLRQATFAQSLLAVAFGAFWSTLALMLHAAPFHLGSAAAGSFGLAGAAGALAAPLAGRLADRRGPAAVTRLGASLVALAFAAMLAQAWLPTTGQLWLIGASAVVFDLGIQATLIAHQTIIYGIDPAARSRLNAVLFVGMFVGMASGSALGGLLFAQVGWTGVVALATVSALLALVVRLRKTAPAKQACLAC